MFVPGLSNPDEIADVVQTLDVPLNVLYTPSGLTVAQLGELGVARVSLGSLLFRVSLGAAIGAALDIRAGNPVCGTIPAYAEVQQFSIQP